MLRSPPASPNRFAFDVPSDSRVVIPVPVLGQGFAVPVLAREAEQRGKRAADASGVAQGIEHASGNRSGNGPYDQCQTEKPED